MITILDGPMGTEIDRLGGDTTLPLWSSRALIEQPDLVRKIHENFIRAGSNIITTNTFRTQEWTLSRAGLPQEKARELTQLAVNLAKQAREGTGNCLIAGSISPLEDCYSPDIVPSNTILKQEHPKIINSLVSAGVDIFLIETMNTIREAQIAYEATKEFPDIPVYVSFTCNEEGKILSGESWKEIINFFIDKVDTILVNCSSLSASRNAIQEMLDLNVNNWGVYPNFGEVNNEKGWTAGLVTQEYEKFIAEVIELQPTVIGTCCGATPKQTETIVRILKNG